MHIICIALFVHCSYRSLACLPASQHAQAERLAVNDTLASFWHPQSVDTDCGKLQEPANPNDEIYQHPNVIATPHTGVASIEVLEQLVSVVCQNIIRRKEGKDLLHRLC